MPHSSHFPRHPIPGPPSVAPPLASPWAPLRHSSPALPTLPQDPRPLSGSPLSLCKSRAQKSRGIKSHRAILNQQGQSQKVNVPASCPLVGDTLGGVLRVPWETRQNGAPMADRSSLNNAPLRHLFPPHTPHLQRCWDHLPNQLPAPKPYRRLCFGRSLN